MRTRGLRKEKREGEHSCFVAAACALSASLSPLLSLLLSLASLARLLSAPPCAFHVLDCTSRPRPPLFANRGFPFRLWEMGAKGGKGAELKKKEEKCFCSQRTRQTAKKRSGKFHSGFSGSLGRSPGRSQLARSKALPCRAFGSQFAHSKVPVLFPAAKST